MTDSTPREQGVIEGWMLAITHLEEYGGAAGQALAKDMRTRFPEVRTDLFVVTEGDYEDEMPEGVYDSLPLAMGQYDVTIEWRGDEETGVWVSLGSVDRRGYRGHGNIYRLTLNKPLEERDE